MKRLLFILPLLLLAACQAATPPTPTATIPPTLTATPSRSPISTATPLPTDLPTDTPSPTPQPVDQRTQYHLLARLDYTLHTLGVQEQITYTNRSDRTLTDLVLVVEPARWTGAFSLASLTWEDGAPAAYTWDVQRMILSLQQPLNPGGRVSLLLEYSLNIPEIPLDADRPVPFGFTARQVNLVDWYPHIAPYHDGWLAHDPGYFGEHQVSESSDFIVDVALESPPPGLIVAASAPLQEVSDGYHAELAAARSFAITASPQYQVYSATLTLASGQLITVTHYTFPFEAAMGPVVLSETVRAVQEFSTLFTPYPHDQLSVVEADFLDGMEYDGLFFLSHGFYNIYNGQPDDYLAAIAIHETAHQWWYALIGNDQALEPWLDEALSTYSEFLYFERVHPSVLDAWWAKRVNFYAPAGLIGQPIYAYPGFLPYRDAVYLRGALFLRDLRSRIGDDAFFAFLKDYAASQERQFASGDEFFAILKLHTSADIGPLLAEYFGDYAPLPCLGRGARGDG